MNRSQAVRVLVAFAATFVVATDSVAQNAWLSLNLEFNTLNDLNSGGVWTTVAKSDSAGLAGISIYLTNATTFTDFLAPPEFDVRVQGLFGAVRNIVVGDNLVAPYPVGIGLIGSSFPSTYVDPPGLVPLGGYTDLGSFTGGVPVATGTFSPGVIPDWASLGGNLSDANVFTGPAPAPVANADTVVTVATVRYTFATVPEPTAISLTLLPAIAAAFARRCFRVRRAQGTEHRHAAIAHGVACRG
jgi:hypothetical protein